MTTMTTIPVHATDFAFPEAAVARVAFGSCHKNKYASRYPELWSTIQQTVRPQMWLWTGDAVYPSTRGLASVEALQEEYDQLLHNPSLGDYASLVQDSHLPHGVWGTWDDHDYGGNDMGESMPNRTERALAYWRFLDRTPPTKLSSTSNSDTAAASSDTSSSSTPPTENLAESTTTDTTLIRQGLYYSVTYGQPPHQIKLIFLDTRWHRQDHCIPSLATAMPLGAGLACFTRWISAGLLSFPRAAAKWWCSPSASLLGTEQWEWLTRELTESQAAIHIVVSSIQVLTTNPVMESWGHYPEERDRLIKLLWSTSTAPVSSSSSESIETLPSGGTIVLSGDVHHGEILDPQPALVTQESPFLEVTSSGLTHDCSRHIYGALCQPLLESFRRHRFHNYHERDLPKKRGLGQEYYYIGRNFGSLTIDWAMERFQVQVHSAEDGRVVLSTGPRTFRPTALINATSDSSSEDPIHHARQQQQQAWIDQQVSQVAPCMDGHLLAWLRTFLVASFLCVILLYRRTWVRAPSAPSRKPTRSRKPKHA